MSLVVGVDPGGTTGLAAVEYDFLTERYQLRQHIGLPMLPDEAVAQVRAMIRLSVGLEGPWWIAAERFVVSRRAGRSATAGAGQRARDILGALEAAFPGRVKLRNAGAAKAWGVNDRVKAAGLWPTQGRPHTTDAVRHALMFQVANLGNPDPLSLTYGARS